MASSIFVGERGHLRLAAPVDQIDGFGAEPPRGRHHVDGRIARADAGDSAADFDLGERLDFGFLDELDGAVDALQIFAGQLEVPGFAQAHADEDGVELFLEIRERDVASRPRTFCRNFTPRSRIISTSRSESAARVL